MIEKISLCVNKFEFSILFLKLFEFLTKSKFDYVSSPRKSAIDGSWAGTVVQDNGINGSDMKTFLNVNLKLNGFFVKGTATIHWDDKSILVDCSGGFINENIIRVSYSANDKSLLYYGVSLLELSPDSKKLEGRIIGYGHLINQMISGKVRISKEGSTR